MSILILTRKMDYVKCNKSIPKMQIKMLRQLRGITIFVELQDCLNKVKKLLIMYTSFNSLKSKNKSLNNSCVIKLIKQFRK